MIFWCNMRSSPFLIVQLVFPPPPGLSELDVGRLDDEWKARHAVRDNNLAEKLCDTLEATLGDMPVTEDSRTFLLRSFLPALSVDEQGMVDKDWSSDNPSEAQVSVILLPRELKLSLW